MAKKPITIDQLARITQEEFAAAGKRVAEGFRAVTDTLDLMRADLHDIKVTLPPLAGGQLALEREVEELKHRVARLERKS